MILADLNMTRHFGFVNNVDCWTSRCLHSSIQLAVDLTVHPFVFLAFIVHIANPLAGLCVATVDGNIIPSSNCQVVRPAGTSNSPRQVDLEPRAALP